MRLKRPWPRGEHVRSPWGPRIHPISGKRKHHRGVDVAYHGEIYAPADGTVVHKGADLNPRTGGGYTLIIRHDNPRVWTAYYHLRQPSHLNIGARVKTGEVLGLTGTTGASTGVHLHFEVRRTRAWGTDVDPMLWLSDEYASEHEERTGMIPEANPEDNRRGRYRPLGMGQYGPNWLSRGARWAARFGGGR